MSPGAGKEVYWKYFLGEQNVDIYSKNANEYFSILNSISYYIDGSSFLGGTESGSERKERGYNYAKQYFKEIIKDTENNKVYLISHSEGCAFAAGVAKYLIEKGIKIGESIMLSADEGDEFYVEENYPCYQIVAGYLVQDFPAPKNKFRIDPVVMDNKIKGVTKYGVYVAETTFASVHGHTLNVKIFDLLKKLKSTNVVPVLNSKGKTVYQTNPKDENWAKIDDYILHNKKVDLYPKLNSNIGEIYHERED